MSDSSKRDKPASVAAFLFMPQLHLSSQHFSFIMPVFIRTVALMFVQAGLLPPNHPAIHYGMEGVKKYKFFELMGESWYRLRSTHATPYQWSIFASVAMMVVVTVLSLVTALLDISGMLVSKASAQIFDSMIGDTSSSTVPGTASLDMFDKTVPAPGTAHGDWGIMILDKMLRQGAEGRGGLLQNAFGSLMQVYNTGILVIAGIMILWLILFVVTDTAKTGQIGGQRHNMVWAPIRIVFALGLLIPLGTNGFSSGQYMVMKLAEWGSNFGSRGWYTYVETIVEQQSLLAKFGSPSPTNLMSQYAQMWLCRVAYNGAANQAGGMNDDQRVGTVRRINSSQTPGRSQFFFTNKTYKNLCGAVDFPAKNTAAILRLLDPSSSAVDQAIGQYQNNLAQGYYDLFFDGDASGWSFYQSDDGELPDTARAFACAFAAVHIFKGVGDPGDEPLFINAFSPFDPANCDGPPFAFCEGGGAGSGKYPSMLCIKQLIEKYNALIKPLHEGGDVLLTDALADNTALLTDVLNQGWPGMGVWYHQIEQMNDAVGQLRKPGLSFTKGDRSPIAGTPAGDAVAEVLNQYRPWWNMNTAIKDAVALSPEIKTSSWASDEISTSASTADLGAKVDGAQDTSPDAFAGEMLEMAGGDGVARFFLDMADPLDADTYPLAKLAKLGGSLQQIALMIYGGIALLEIVGAGVAGALGHGAAHSLAGGLGAGALLGILEGVKAFIAGPVTAVITTFAGIVFAASLVLLYYIPMLPFVRVAYSVLTWMISVFEAVVMVPIAALAHLTTEGEGLAGGAKQAWILWLNVLLRPILTVIGFVGALLVFNTFVVWIHEAFSFFMMDSAPRGAGSGHFGPLMFCLIYVFVIYTVANTCFKMLDIIPAAMFKWIGGGQADSSFDDDGAKGMIGQAGKFGDAMGRKMQVAKTGPSSKRQAQQADEVASQRKVPDK